MEGGMMYNLLFEKSVDCIKWLDSVLSSDVGYKKVVGWIMFPFVALLLLPFWASELLIPSRKEGKVE